mmetsp:Transcript_12218/g.13351  ORF Transcript_12218/g.13351 Transcript_12218/m.13351 type:complete len:272 (+) Transcript_12218:51-866(+)
MARKISGVFLVLALTFCVSQVKSEKCDAAIWCFQADMVCCKNSDNSSRTCYAANSDYSCCKAGPRAQAYACQKDEHCHEDDGIDECVECGTISADHNACPKAYTNFIIVMVSIVVFLILATICCVCFVKSTRNRQKIRRQNKATKDDTSQSNLKQPMAYSTNQPYGNQPIPNAYVNPTQKYNGGDGSINSATNDSRAMAMMVGSGMQSGYADTNRTGGDDHTNWGNPDPVLSGQQYQTQQGVTANTNFQKQKTTSSELNYSYHDTAEMFKQ